MKSYFSKLELQLLFYHYKRNCTMIKSTFSDVEQYSKNGGKIERETAGTEAAKRIRTGRHFVCSPVVNPVSAERSLEAS